MRAPAILLKIHLVLGLVAAVFLAILGLTGSVMAFENDIDHWLHPGLFYVAPASSALPEEELIGAVNRRFAPARVNAVQVARSADIARAMQMTDGRMAFVNPYNGSILGSVHGGFPSDRIIGWIHQIHLRLVPDPRSAPRFAAIGKRIVSFAGLILCLLVPTGVILFVRTRRTTIKWNASWFRIFFDAHHVVGIYAALFLLIAAFTGIMIGFESGERAIYAATHSGPPARVPPVHSSNVEGAAPITADRAVDIARQAMPGASVAGIFIPMNAQAVFTVLMRFPEDTSEAVHSGVSIDQFSGKVLQSRNFLTDSPGYRVIRFNRSIHTGDIWGLPSHVLVSISSLALVAMVVTGLVIWWKKLAI
ncbi:MAG: PepSY-associated TM helix domain-containing protein [Bryobacteraceae bacterium]|jgi:uncharacterized iron-regulated membrane protein